MASSSSSTKIKEPEEDPYEILGLEFPVTDDAVITKAYRKMALQFHPDKQKQSATQAQADAMAVKFHQLQRARAFLLDAEFQASRQAYDRKRASQQQRRAHERAQLEKLSDHRKRMQQELAAAEAEAARKKQKPQGASSTSTASRREELRRKGQAMREAHSAASQERDEQEAFSSKTALSSRQVRLKWSRKRVKHSPSEDSIAREFGARFGPIEAVEMIGHKGNAALVTFRQASSCRPCVEFYQTSDEMRASYIQKPTAQEEPVQTEPTAFAASSAAATTTSRDYESVAEWQARRAAARASVVQEGGQDENEQTSGSNTSKPFSHATFTTDFLPKFPASRDPSLSFWDQLSALEEQILAPLVGHERVKELQKS